MSEIAKRKTKKDLAQEEPKVTEMTLARTKRETYSEKNLKDVKEHYLRSVDRHGARKVKVIQVLTYKNGVVRRRIKGILKNGEVIYNNGIKDIKAARSESGL